MGGTIHLVLIILAIICFAIRGFGLFPTGKVDLGWVGAMFIGIALLF